MFRLSYFFATLIFVSLIGTGQVFSQEEPDISPSTTVRAIPSVTPVTSEEKKGSTIRGRVFYRDTGKPVRRGWVGFVKIKELIELPVSKDSPKMTKPFGSGNSNADNYALTNAEGAFVIKDINSGIYQAIVKVSGILNPTVFDRENPEFQQFAIDGISETYVNVTARRGASISGVVTYSDGDPVVGAKVQALKKNFSYSEYIPGNSPDDITVTETDDRGFYRFTGLPERDYVIQVTERSFHSDSEDGYPTHKLNHSSYSSVLKTYYSSSQTIKDATVVKAVLGYEQTGTDITVPDRSLFEISGDVVSKLTNVPLENVSVSFSKIMDDGIEFDYYQDKTVSSNEQGKWSLKEIPKGKYRINFSHKDPYNYDQDAKTNEKKPKYASTFLDVEIDAANLSNLNTKLSIEATISGTVKIETDKPFGNFVLVGAIDAEKQINEAAYLSGDDTGTEKSKISRKFTISGLSEGNFRIVALTDDYYLKSARRGSTDLLSTKLKIKDGEKIEGVQIVLGTDVGILRGKVEGLENAKGPVFVVMVPRSGNTFESLVLSRSSTVSPDGMFEVKGAPGEYLVVAIDRSTIPKNLIDQPTISKNLEEWFSEKLKGALATSLKARETTTIDLELLK